MFNSQVTVARKNHAGKPFAGLVDIESKVVAFFTADDAAEFVADHAEFFAEFVKVEVVKDID